MKIAFLVHDVHGDDGANRTVLTLGQALAATHDVEVVSVFRGAGEPAFALPAAVRIRFLVDLHRADRAHPLRLQPSELVPPAEERFAQYSRLTDERIVHHLRHTRADVVVGTRPSLNLLVAGFAPESSVRLAQEHVTRDLLPEPVKAALRAAYPRLHAALTMTALDAEDLRREQGGPQVFVLPNSVPRPRLAPAAGTSNIIVAAGRLVPEKRYDVLVTAFRKVRRRHPDWRLRIYGRGPERTLLQALAAELGLHDDVLFMSRWRDMEPEWVKGSVAALTSERESFGTSIVEAMRAGLPVVSTACHAGPAEIIQDGVDGLLCPVNDADAVAAALDELIGDAPRRARMAEAARRNSERFDPATASRRFEELVESGTAARATRRRPLAGTVRQRWAQAHTLAGHVSVAWRSPARGRLLAASLFDLTAGTAVGRCAARGALWVGTVQTPLRAPSRAVYRALTRRALPDFDTVAADCEVPRRDVAELRVRVGGAHLRPEALVLKAAQDLDGRPVAALRSRSVVVPFEARRSGTGMAWTAVVAADTLGEGNWAAYARMCSGALRRIEAGQIDTRAVVSAPLASAALDRVIPYETVRGFLTLRVWRRSEHAEVDRLDCTPQKLTITGRLVPRRPAEMSLTFVRQQDGAKVRVPAAVRDDGGFTAELPIGELVTRRLSRHDNWAAYLVSPVSGAPVRLARLLDDLPHRASATVLPTLPLDAPEEWAEEWPKWNLWARPTLTAGGDLSFSVGETAVRGLEQ